MLPLVLGGVALATVGYGVRMLVEEVNCAEATNYTEMYELEEEEKKRKKELKKQKKKKLKVLRKYDKKLEKFYQTKFSKLQNTLEKINSLNFKAKKEFKKDENVGSIVGIDIFKYIDIKEVNVSNEDLKKIKSYTKILKNLEIYLDSQLKELSKLLEKSNNYESYDEGEKKFIQNLLYLNNTVERILDSNVLEVGEDFEKIEKVMS